MSETNDLNTTADSSAEMLTLARQATARIVTAAIEATAESADMERAVLARKFPAMSSLPPPLRVDPQQIRDFTKSPGYADLVEQYVQGRIEGHLLTRALDLLSQYLPILFAR
ncbi:MAG: hypothetical protein PHU85_01485 [Phycisphaerae bacterium]|nr:hypothetical protein [Phycisphaerae bacterium]